MNKTTKTFTTAAIGFVALGLSACDQASSSAASPRVSLRVLASTTPLAAGAARAMPDSGVVDMNGLPVVLTSARAWVRDVQLESENGNDSTENEFKAGPILLDLLSGQSSPALSSITMPTGMYDKIKIKLGKAIPTAGMLDSTDSMVGHSLWLEGTVGGVPFHLGLDLDRELEFKLAKAVPLTSDSLRTLVARLDRKAWFAMADLKACADSTAANPGTQPKACGDIHDSVRNGLESSEHGGDMDHPEQGEGN